MPRLIAICLVLALGGCTQLLAVKGVLEKADALKWQTSYKLLCGSRYDTEMAGIKAVGVSPDELRTFCGRAGGLSR